MTNATGSRFQSRQGFARSCFAYSPSKCPTEALGSVLGRFHHRLRLSFPRFDAANSAAKSNPGQYLQCPARRWRQSMRTGNLKLGRSNRTVIA